MYFAATSAEPLDDESRVAFALSYLSDTPLDFFQSEISGAIFSGGILPSWFRSYTDFISELRRLFGPNDPATGAMEALEALSYNDFTKAIRYTTDFNRFARCSGWNDRALAHQYYKGLPDRLKDELARIGKPGTLGGLQDLVSILDQRYWERQSEIISRSPSPSAVSDTSSARSATSAAFSAFNTSANSAETFSYSADELSAASDSVSDHSANQSSDSDADSAYFSAESA
jgi:hypothetical protein